MPGPDLKAITASITKLPTLPEVAMRLICAVGDPASSGADVSKLLTGDPALVGQVLKLVNSAYFGLMEKVSDVHRAVNLLGFRQIRSIALGASVIRVFGASGPEQFDFKRFWLHSLAVANLCGRVARLLPKTDPEEAYVVGLMHDTGKLVLHQYLQGDFQAIVDRAQKGSLSFYAAERSVLESHHGEIAAWLVEQWDLGGPIADGIRWHHSPERYAENRLAGVCRFANYVCAVKFLACSGSFDRVSLEEPVWEPLGLTQGDFLSIVNEADKEIALAGDMLQAMT